MPPKSDQRSFDQKLADLKKAHAAGLVVGLRDFGIAYRLDIDALLTKQPDTFNLFLIALDSLQNEEPSTNIMGYFQIAGIHGFPKENWFGIPGRKNNSQDPGYCAHGAETFPTWHRPYLAMLEQAIFIKMIDVANRYTDPKTKTKFVDAAINFRLPFFDYFRPRAGPGRFTFPGVISEGQTAYDYDYSMPAIFTTPNVTIRDSPDARPRQISNPLHHYNFQSKTSKVETGQLSSQEWDSISKNTVAFPRDRTVRHPTAKSPDNPDRLNSVLNELRMDSNRLAVTMVTNDLYRNYATFSTNRAGVQTIDKPLPDATAAEKILFGRSGAGSLEAIHGIYHVLIGGWGRQPSGHMSEVPCAAFDPVFWAHHGNIERLFSIWQAVHVEESDTNWFSDSNLAKSSLLPFLKPDGIGKPGDRFWTSNASDNCEWFGYTYTDLDDSKTSVADRFRNLYAWSTPRIPNQAKQTPPDNMKPIDVSQSEFFKPPSGPRTKLLALRNVQDLATPLQTHIQKPQVPISTKTDKNIAWDWFVDDRVERLALNSSFTISYFVLASPHHTLGAQADVVLDPALVGLTHIFTSSVESCSNCAEQGAEKVMVRNTVPFTSQLLDYIAIGQLNSMEPDDVLAFLKQRLRWRIVKADGQSVDPRNMSSLTISVSAKRTVLDEQLLPTAQVEYHEYPELVRDIIAGASAEAGHMA